MCNLYRMANSAAEVASLFNAIEVPGANFGAEVYPGYPGLIVAKGKVGAMTWGFPLTMKSKRTGEPLKPKPVNNARTDKLDSAFWRSSFERRRCLIPVSAFAEAEGAKGAKTRTWFSMEDRPLFAVAGLWRPSAEWGQCYSMVMTDASDAICGLHDRMPVILPPDAQATWLDGTADEALALCQPYDGALGIERTQTPWAGPAR